MTPKELEEMLPTLSTEQLLNVFDYVARESGVLGYKYCIVREEIYHRLEANKND